MSRAVKVVVAVIALSLLGAAPASAQKVLVFSKTAGFRHDSIPQGIAAVQAIGQANGFAVDATEDAGQFTAANLAQYKAVVWLSTTGDVLNEAQQTAFEGYIRAGGGYVGVHAAADTEYSGRGTASLVGAYFNSHPANQNAKVDVIDRAHPSTSHLQAAWTRFDEWYNYRSSPRQKVHVLAELDESSYSPEAGDGRRPPDRLVPELRRRPHLVHGHGPHAGVLRRHARSAGIWPAASCGRRGWRPATARSTSRSRARPPRTSSRARAGLPVVDRAPERVQVRRRRRGAEDHDRERRPLRRRRETRRT